MLWAAFTLAFFVFLPASEFTCNGPFNPEVHLTSQDITFHPDIQSPSLMRVRIKQSKTDLFRQGCTLTIAKSTSPICSVMAMKDYILQAQPPASFSLLCSLNVAQGWYAQALPRISGLFHSNVAFHSTTSTPTAFTSGLPHLLPQQASLPD